MPSRKKPCQVYMTSNYTPFPQNGLANTQGLFNLATGNCEQALNWCGVRHRCAFADSTESSNVVERKPPGKLKQSEAVKLCRVDHDPQQGEVIT